MQRHRSRVGECGHLVDDDTKPRRVVNGLGEPRGVDRLQGVGRGQQQPVGQLCHDVALARVPLRGAFAHHHVLGGDCLEHSTLVADRRRYDEVGVVPGQGRRTEPFARCILGGSTEPTDETAGRALQQDQGTMRVVETLRPAVQREQPVERLR